MGYLKNLLNWLKKPALDYSMTNYTVFKFKDKKDLMFKDEKRGKILYDALDFSTIHGTDHDGMLKVRKVNMNNNGMFGYCTPYWNRDLLERIWNEKYEVAPFYVSPGYHINFYMNTKSEFNPMYPGAYLDKNAKYLFTVMRKDDPMIGYIKDHIMDVKPFEMLPQYDLESVFANADVWEEKFREIHNKDFELPAGSTPFEGEDTATITKAEQVIADLTVQMTDCVNMTKVNSIVAYNMKNFKEKGFTADEIVAYGHALIINNNTQIANLMIDNAIKQYPELASELPAIGGGPLAIEGDNNTAVVEQMPKGKITFSDLVDISNKTQSLILAKRIQGINTPANFKGLAEVFKKRESKEETKSRAFLNVWANTLLKLNSTGYITPRDTQLNETQVEQYMNSMETYDGNFRLTLAQFMNAFGKYKRQEGLEEGRVETMKTLGPVMAEQQRSIVQQNSTINALTGNVNDLKDTVSQYETNMTKMVDEYRKNITDTSISSYNKGFQDSQKLVSEHLALTAEQTRKAAEQGRAKVEAEKNAFTKELGKRIRKRLYEQGKVIPIKTTDEELAKEALADLKKEQMDVIQAVEMGITKQQSNDLLDKITSYITTPKVDEDAIDDLPDRNEQKIAQLDKNLDDIYGMLYEISKNTKHTPTPTPVPTPMPTPKPTPKPTPTPLPTPTPFPTEELVRQIASQVANQILNQTRPPPTPTPMPEPEPIKPSELRPFYRTKPKIFQTEMHKPPESSIASIPTEENTYDNDYQYTQSFWYGFPSFGNSPYASGSGGETAPPPPLVVYYPVKKRNAAKIHRRRVI